VLTRALRRTARRVFLGQRLYAGNRETLRGALLDLEAPLWLVVRTHGRRRRQLPDLFRRGEYGLAAVIQLRTPAATERFLAEAAFRMALVSGR
jgi:hypothetical protein